MSGHAIVRDVPGSFVDSLVAADPRPHIDATTARRQHDGYCRALAEAGLELIRVGADEAHPDCPFVEDVAVVLGEVALATIPGAPSRRGEVGPVSGALARHLPVIEMEPPATLDGGDVLIMGTTVFVGRSERTNDEGIRQLDAVARRQGLDVVPVPVERALHLKTVVDRLADGTVLMAPGQVPLDPFAGLRIIETAPGEEAAANVLAIGEQVLISPAFVATADRIAALGLTPLPVDTTEFAKADGGLTCLSIRL